MWSDYHNTIMTIVVSAEQGNQDGRHPERSLFGTVRKFNPINTTKSPSASAAARLADQHGIQPDRGPASEPLLARAGMNRVHIGDKSSRLTSLNVRHRIDGGSALNSETS
jgi:hypothetical protein